LHDSELSQFKDNAAQAAANSYTPSLPPSTILDADFQAFLWLQLVLATRAYLFKYFSKYFAQSTLNIEIESTIPTIVLTKADTMSLPPPNTPMMMLIESLPP
jgi:hypothetical protein